MFDFQSRNRAASGDTAVVLLVLDRLNFNNTLWKSAVVNSFVTVDWLSGKTNISTIRSAFLLCDIRCCYSA